MAKQLKGYGLTTRSGDLGRGLLIFLGALVLAFFTLLGYVALVRAEVPPAFRVCVLGGSCADLPTDKTATLENGDVVCTLATQEARAVLVCGPKPTKAIPKPTFFGTHVDCSRFDQRAATFAVVAEETQIIEVTCLGGLT